MKNKRRLKLLNKKLESYKHVLRLLEVFEVDKLFLVPTIKITLNQKFSDKWIKLGLRYNKGVKYNVMV